MQQEGARRLAHRNFAKHTEIGDILNSINMVAVLGPESEPKSGHAQRRRDRTSSLGVSVFAPGMWARFCGHQNRPANA
jgi:hypothetical protein